MSEPLLEIQAAADDLWAAFPRVAYVQRNAVKLATVALRRLADTRTFTSKRVEDEALRHARSRCAPDCGRCKDEIAADEAAGGQCYEGVCSHDDCIEHRFSLTELGHATLEAAR